RSPDCALRALAVGGGAPLRGLEGLAEAGPADREDVLFWVDAGGERPQHVLDVVDVDVLVHDDAEAGAQRDRERGGQDVALQALGARAALLYLEDHAAPLGHAPGGVRVDAEPGHDAPGRLE